MVRVKPPLDRHRTVPSNGRVKLYEHTPQIEIKQLRYFLAVADHLNFTRASEYLHLAQPALSQHILALEQQLRVPLFVRSRRMVTLTPEGEALVAYARRLTNSIQVATETVQAISRGEQGPLILGAIFSSLFSVIPSIMSPFVQRYPGVKLHLQEMTLSEQTLALKEHRIDAGILRGPIDEPEFESFVLLREGWVAMVAKSHHFGSQETLSLEEIASQPMVNIFSAANGDVSRSLFSAFIDRGHTLNIVQETPDTQTLIGLAAAGIGISVVPESVQAIQIPRVRYIPIRDAMPATTIELVWHRDNTTPVLLNFIDMVEAISHEPMFGSWSGS